MNRNYEVRIAGVTPLLMHWDNIEWADEMDAWKADPKNKKNSRAGDDRTPGFRWIGSCYHDGEHVAIPAELIAACLLGGGAMVPVPGAKGNKTFKAQTQSGMAVDEQFCRMLVNGKQIPYKPIDALRAENNFPEHRKAVEKLGFSLLVKRAAVGSSKHIRVRPMFSDWALEFTLAVWDDQLTPDALRDIFTFSGLYKGLGDWRPGSPKKPGPYGRFRLETLQG